MADVAHHIPVGVICEMLGAPHDHDRELVEWSDALVGAVHPMVDDAELVRANDGARAFREFVGELISARRAEPRDDLITALVHAESDGDLLTGDELVSTVILFIGAGIENTKHFIGSCFHALLDDRELALSVRTDPTLVAPFSEEVLRLEPPVQIAVPRLALDDVVLSGVRVPAGEQICVVVPGANRDPAVYTRSGRPRSDARRPAESLARDRPPPLRGRGVGATRSARRRRPLRRAHGRRASRLARSELSQ